MAAATRRRTAWPPNKCACPPTYTGDGSLGGSGCATSCHAVPGGAFPDAAFRAGTALDRLGDPARARPLFERAVRGRPAGFPEALTNLGGALQQLGRPRAA